MEWVATIITGLLTFLGSIYNQNQVKKTNEESINFSRESAATAQQYSKDLLDYNSPSYQMSRIVQAGLNPNLVADNLDSPVPTGVQATQPNLKPPTIETDYGIDDALKIAQINRLNAAADNETKYTDTQIDTLYKHQEVQEAEIENLKAQSLQLTQAIAESQSRIQVLSQRERQIYLDNYFRSETMDSSIKKLAADAGISETEAKFRAKFISASIFNLKSQSEMYLSQAKLNKENESVARALSHLYGVTATGVIYDNALKLQDVKASYMPSGFARNSLGYEAAKSNLKSSPLRYQIVAKQNELLQKYGGAEKMANIVNTWTNSFLQFNQAIQGWFPQYQKSSSPSGVKRSETSYFPIN